MVGIPEALDVPVVLMLNIPGLAGFPVQDHIVLPESVKYSSVQISHSHFGVCITRDDLGPQLEQVQP